jgi:hypothetical protein
MEPTPRKPGRPRQWRSEAEKHRHHRARRAQRQRLLDDLLLAVRNARLDDPELHRVAQRGDDAALLHALIRYYGDRHWCQPRLKPETPLLTA